MKRIFISLYLVFLTTACSHLGEQFKQLETPQQNESFIYIYRPSKMYGGGISYEIKNYHEKILDLYNGGYYLYKTSPGRKEISSTTPMVSNIKFDAAGGKSYFIKGKLINYLPSYGMQLRMVSPEEAINELKFCKIIKQN